MIDLVFYVSGHGFGHAVRSAEVIQALLRLRQDVRVHVRTLAPRWIFPEDAERIDVRPVGIDVGAVQRDSLSVDPAATVARYREHMRGEDALMEREVGELARFNPRLIVADVPALAFPIAARLGAPGVGIANFSWDWIYEPYVAADPEGGELIGRLRAQYGQASLLLRLPMHGDLSAFPTIEDIPLIARVSRVDRAALRQRLRLPAGRPLVLVSFGGFEFNGLDPEAMSRLRDYCFVTVGEPKMAPVDNQVYLPRDGYQYVDLLASVDVVLAKPGYGIVADCLANRVPLVFARRGGFREEDVLVRAIQELGLGSEVSRESLARWEIGESLGAALGRRAKASGPSLDGASVAAARLATLMADGD
ncbi:MAG: glycosyltransferase family protein [Chloroflexota bacterium]